MRRRGLVILVSFFLLLSLLVSNVYAQEDVSQAEERQEDEGATETEVEEETTETKVEEEFKDAELEAKAGITPDSSFYFVEDSILTKFRDDSENREKKIAEIKEMIKENNIEAARKSLGKYNQYAENLEKEVDPDKKEEAQRSAVAIRKTIREIESEIPESERGEFVDDVIEKEKGIITAAEIAGKIKELCQTLSKIDPLEYSRVCKTEENAPRWQRRLDKELTAEQEKEAREFFGIMSQCFRNPEECKCEDIKVTAFAEKCKIIAPLAAECQKGNEEACEKVDEEDPIDLLPPHLQAVLEEVEDEFEDAGHDLHLPKECEKEGATDRKSCMLVMFKLNAPEECIAALERGEISITNEREAREKCEEIMFKANAPEECIEAGLKDPKECGKLMFKLNAPEECIEAGLTGESRSDDKKCREMMDSQRNEGRGPGGFGPPAFGRNCKEIQNPEEKIKCLEEFYNSAQQQGGFPGQGQGPGPGDERMFRFPRECEEKGITSPEECRKIMDELYKSGKFRPPEGEFREGEFRPPTEFRPPEGEFREGEFSPPPEESFQEPPTESSGTSESSTTTSPSSSTESSGTSESSSSGEGSTSLTGSVISTANPFIDYYFK
ncbi:MAG: hypothetical protein AABX73_04305 [Nanoarchaeota archaeon]